MSHSEKNNEPGSLWCIDDCKEDCIIPGTEALCKDDTNKDIDNHKSTALRPELYNHVSVLHPTANYNHSKNWFTVNDKLDVLHDEEWYRAEIKEVEGYSIYVQFEGQDGRITKWIKDCNQIFKYICQCTKECNNNIHAIAGYGAQTNYSYDEQIVLCDPHAINFTNVIHNILFKYIGYNIRDATNSADQFDQDFECIQESFSKCHSMNILLQKYQDLHQELISSFSKSSETQQSASTNAITLGQYIKYMKTCNQTKFKNAIKQQHDDIKNIDDALNDTEKQINQLIKQQNQMRLRKNDQINTLKHLKYTRNKHKEYIQMLVDEQKHCVENVNKATNILHRYWTQHKQTLNELHIGKLREFEKEYKIWDKQDTIAWIMMIDNQRFSSNHKYAKFRKMLNKSRINGAMLNDLKSDLFLKYVGLGIESRTALINNINRVLMQQEHK